jgi:hypothetical protein
VADDMPLYIIIENAVLKTNFNGVNGSIFIPSKKLSVSISYQASIALLVLAFILNAGNPDVGQEVRN